MRSAAVAHPARSFRRAPLADLSSVWPSEWWYLAQSASDADTLDASDHVHPPSTTKLCAVTRRLSSAASQRTMRAISGG
jgi:hypothetical protein